MTDKYILDGKIPVLEPDLMKWARWFDNVKRRVDVTVMGPFRVSTVFLGIDHRHVVADPPGPPILFETMVFRDDPPEQAESDLWCERASTWDEAEAMHERGCAYVREHLLS